MRRLGPKLSYANVVATLALFLALGGGAVWAAGKITSNQIGKGQVKTKNLAKKAVKTKNLGGNAVTAAKLKKNAVNFNKLAAGTNVVASATAGPVSAKQEGPVNVPLSKQISITPVDGQVFQVQVGAEATLKASGAETCQVLLLPFVNGAPELIGELLSMVSPDVPPNPIFPNGIPTGSVAFPIGLTQPGKAQNLTLSLIGSSTHCTNDSQIDKISIVVTRVK